MHAYIHVCMLAYMHTCIHSCINARSRLAQCLNKVKVPGPPPRTATQFDGPWALIWYPEPPHTGLLTREPVLLTRGLRGSFSPSWGHGLNLQDPSQEHGKIGGGNACMHACMRACMYVCMYACMYVCMTIHVCTVCMYVCMYVCIYACMCVCLRLHANECMHV